MKTQSIVIEQISAEPSGRAIVRVEMVAQVSFAELAHLLAVQAGAEKIASLGFRPVPEKWTP